MVTKGYPHRCQPIKWEPFEVGDEAKCIQDGKGVVEFLLLDFRKWKLVKGPSPSSSKDGLKMDSFSMWTDPTTIPAISQMPSFRCYPWLESPLLANKTRRWRWISPFPFTLQTIQFTIAILSRPPPYPTKIIKRKGVSDSKMKDKTKNDTTHRKKAYT